MKNKVSRRTFIRKSAHLGAASMVGGALAGSLGCDGEKPGEQEPSAAAPRGEELPHDAIAVATGEKWYDGTRKAVGLLGGMGRFVPKGARVGFLANSQRNNPGTFTKGAIIRAVVEMCLEAGAKEVNCLTWLPRKNWESTGLAEAVEDAGARMKVVNLRDESLFKPVPIPEGVKLKEARIMNAFFENDVFINLPIVKNHSGNWFTGAMKNLMGVNSSKSNLSFHTGNFKNDDIEHLDQCIADLNLLFEPHLCVVDATEFIITNGPFGPGELHKPQKVVAGTDRVAVDAYCAALWGLEPEKIHMIRMAHEHGIGEINVAKKTVTEVTV